MSSLLARLLAALQPPPAPPAVPPDARVASDATRCVQCGVCGYNCPVGIPVRDYARQGLTVTDARCVQCSQCIEACPRGTLRWERQSLGETGNQGNTGNMGTGS